MSPPTHHTISSSSTTELHCIPLKTLHWLPVSARVDYKPLSMAACPWSSSNTLSEPLQVCGLHRSVDYAGPWTTRVRGLHGSVDYTGQSTTRVSRLHGSVDYTGQSTTRVSRLHGSVDYTGQSTTRVSRLHGSIDYTGQSTTQVCQLYRYLSSSNRVCPQY